jgi:hypothetical protein
MTAKWRHHAVYSLVYSILQKSVAKSGLLENAIDSRMRIKTITYSDVLTKALPVLLARTFAHHYKQGFRPIVNCKRQYQQNWHGDWAHAPYLQELRLAFVL